VQPLAFDTQVSFITVFNIRVACFERFILESCVEIFAPPEPNKEVAQISSHILPILILGIRKLQKVCNVLIHITQIVEDVGGHFVDEND
jgi:hypothetical protein